MSEAEWKLASSTAPEADGDPVFTQHYNLGMAYGSPSPVSFHAAGQSKEGLNDLYGNVWEWLSNHWYPLPGFKPHPLYEDFSEPYFDDQHGMLAGGSWASTGTCASKYYRLWFRRGFLQFAGFRLAKDH